jgi:hypothetical protein
MVFTYFRAFTEEDVSFLALELDQVIHMNHQK